MEEKDDKEKSNLDTQLGSNVMEQLIRECNAIPLLDSPEDNYPTDDEVFEGTHSDVEEAVTMPHKISGQVSLNSVIDVSKTTLASLNVPEPVGENELTDYEEMSDEGDELKEEASVQILQQISLPPGEQMTSTTTTTHRSQNINFGPPQPQAHRRKMNKRYGHTESNIKSKRSVKKLPGDTEKNANVLVDGSSSTDDSDGAEVITMTEQDLDGEIHLEENEDENAGTDNEDLHVSDGGEGPSKRLNNTDPNILAPVVPDPEEALTDYECISEAEGEVQGEEIEIDAGELAFPAMGNEVYFTELDVDKGDKEEGPNTDEEDHSHASDEVDAVEEGKEPKLMTAIEFLVPGTDEVQSAESYNFRKALYDSLSREAVKVTVGSGEPESEAMIHLVDALTDVEDLSDVEGAHAGPKLADTDSEYFSGSEDEFMLSLSEFLTDSGTDTRKKGGSKPREKIRSKRRKYHRAKPNPHNVMMISEAVNADNDG